METAVLAHRCAPSQAVTAGPFPRNSGTHVSGCRSPALSNYEGGFEAKSCRAAVDGISPAAAAARSKLGNGGSSGRDEYRSSSLNWREFRGGLSFHGCNKVAGRPASLMQCDKMYVPGFWERSPEKKAAENLHNFFTFIAVKIVLAQLQSYNGEDYDVLMEVVNRVSLKDGDKFFKTLMRESYRHKALALRIMEVRSAYCKSDFEWKSLERLCKKHVDESNTRLMREYLVETSEFKE